MKWLKYPLMLGVSLFFIGIFFMFMVFPESGTVIIIGVLCIGFSVVAKMFLEPENEKE